MRNPGRVLTQTAAERGLGHFELALLVMPEAEKRWRRRDEDEEPVEDSCDRLRAGAAMRALVVRNEM